MPSGKCEMVRIADLISILHLYDPYLTSVQLLKIRINLRRKISHITMYLVHQNHAVYWSQSQLNRKKNKIQYMNKLLDNKKKEEKKQFFK